PLLFGDRHQRPLRAAVRIAPGPLHAHGVASQSRNIVAGIRLSPRRTKAVRLPIPCARHDPIPDHLKVGRPAPRAPRPTSPLSVSVAPRRPRSGRPTLARWRLAISAGSV